MVIGDRFAWAHMPKTAGNATTAMFLAVPGLVRFADRVDVQDKHLPFTAREEQIAGKLLVMGIRRLPAWILSSAHHAAAYGIPPDYRPWSLPSSSAMSATGDGDFVMRSMTGDGRVGIDRWIRSEALVPDFLTLLAELGVLNPNIERRIRAIGELNVGSYERDLRRRFTEAQIRTMYERNPTWACIEDQVYGDRIAGSLS